MNNNLKDKYFDFLIHGGDYNPDQWINTPEIWEEDMRLMKAAHINSATVGIFAWSLLEPEEGKYNFEWLDKLMDMLAENKINAILATPSGARPAWMAEKYPEVLRVEENGIRNEYGVRHNHCPTSLVYREKVRNINTLLAKRYKNHPALKMWHINNEYSGVCHCELCQQKFREWLKDYYHNDINELNAAWWNGFWAHNLNDFSQINSPKYRGENHVSALKLAWNRFVTDNTIDFYENEIAPLREITPDIPITTNCMRMYDGVDYQKFAKHMDLICWDNYPEWGKGNNEYIAAESAFVHDCFRSMKSGKPFFMMESTPSVVNWRGVNKIPEPGIQTLSGVESIAFGSDSVQYFQWRKSRGGHEKYHGAVVSHDGTENTRVFREVTETGKALESLAEVTGTRCNSKVAVICDWENMWAFKYFHGYNNEKRDYVDECVKWYTPFFKRGISVDVIPMDADYSQYDLIIAPCLYMLKDGTAEKIRDYVSAGGNFACTYLTGLVDKNDLCYLGGFPGNGLREVFGIMAEETDALPKGMEGKAEFRGKEYDVNHMCDILIPEGAEILGTYKKYFYADTPAVTVNKFNNGKAYYVAFRNDADFADDFCGMLINENHIISDSEVAADEGLVVRKRGDFIFIMNFTDKEKSVALDKEYLNIVSNKKMSGKITVNPIDFIVLK